LQYNADNIAYLYLSINDVAFLSCEERGEPGAYWMDQGGRQHFILQQGSLFKHVVVCRLLNRLWKVFAVSCTSYALHG
jgi:hypothetical protein